MPRYFSVVWMEAWPSNIWICSKSPPDLRHTAGGEIEQIQFLLGHASVQTTERYIGCKQKLGQAVNNRIEFRFGSS
jgi:integrase